MPDKYRYPKDNEIQEGTIIAGVFELHSEKYCRKIDNIDKVKAIRAVQEAFLQLSAIGERVEVDGMEYDNAPALEALREVLIDAGHIGFENE